MKSQSRRAKRMQRHHSKKAGGLNLVSLMDIFTILVFFLLVNSSSSPQLPGKKDLDLPRSTAKAAPIDDYFLAISTSAILFAGQHVIDLSALGYSPAEIVYTASGAKLVSPALDQNRVIIAPLKDALITTINNAQIESEGPHSLTIVADEALPYDLMRRIILTCQSANFLNIRFAATQVVASE